MAALDPQAAMAEVASDRILSKMWAGVFRNALEMDLNLRAFLSAKTRTYFAEGSATA